MIDIGLLYLLLAFDVHEYVARAISLPTSLLAGYALNRYFTFHHIGTARALWQSLARHFSVHSTGGAVNLGVYAAVLKTGGLMEAKIAASAAFPLVALWIGGFVGMCFNFFFAKKMVFDA